MKVPITPHLLDLISEAALKSFWRKRVLAQFLRRCGVAQTLLAGWTGDDSMRDLLCRLLPEVEASEDGAAVITKMADSLAEQESFPDLENWEDSAQKKKEAFGAVHLLRDHLKKARQEALDAKERDDNRKRAAAERQKISEAAQNLDKFTTSLNALAQNIGSQEAGYRFQDWFYGLVDYFEIESRKPYSVAGRQIDGSLTVDGTTYLSELKFTREQAGAPDVDIFRRKVESKADNTMGLMVSMSGYSSTALEAASGPKTPILLIDYSHLYLLLSGSIKMDDLIRRMRRHASQTGHAYLAVSEFSG